MSLLMSDVVESELAMVPKCCFDDVEPGRGTARWLPSGRMPVVTVAEEVLEVEQSV